MKSPLLLTRRKLLRRTPLILAVPALLRASVANAAWTSFTAFGSGGVIGLVKPAGSPTMIGNPLGIIFYGVDTGLGTFTVVQDCSPGHTFDPPNYLDGSVYPVGSPHISPASPPNDPDIPDGNMPTGSTPGGPAILFPGTFQKPGVGTVTTGNSFDGGGGPGGTPLRDAVNLLAAGTGAAFTMACTFLQRSNTLSGAAPLICGRGMNLDSNWYICAFLANITSQLSFNWSLDHSGTSPSSPFGMAGNYSLNAVHTAVAVCWNTAPGVTSINLYLDGTQVASTTGTTMADVSSLSSSYEDQFQVGAQFHVGAGQSDQGAPCSVYQAAIAPQQWTPTQVANCSANPYQYLKF